MDLRNAVIGGCLLLEKGDSLCVNVSGCLLWSCSLWLALLPSSWHPVVTAGFTGAAMGDFTAAAMGDSMAAVLATTGSLVEALVTGDGTTGGMAVGSTSMCRHAGLLLSPTTWLPPHI